MSNSRLLSLLSVALLLSCAGSTLFAMESDEKSNNNFDPLQDLQSMINDQRQTNFNMGTAIYALTEFGSRGYASFMSKDDDVATLKENSRVYRTLHDIKRSARMNLARQAVLLNYTGSGSGSSIGISQFEAGGRWENHPKCYAGAESGLHMTNTFSILTLGRQLGHIEKIQDIAQDIAEYISFNDAPEEVRTTITELIVGSAGHFAVLGEKWVLNWACNYFASK